MNIDFVFDNEVENFENNYEQDFTAIIEQALKTLGIEDDVEVSCVLVDDERILKLIENIVILIVLLMLSVSQWKIMINFM